MRQADTFETYMLSLINADRAKVGAPPLKLEQNLNASAEGHSNWMLAADVFSHSGRGGSSATERMRDAGFDFGGSWRSAENIAVQSERGATGIRDDVADLHISLMNSPGHRANLLNPALDYIGIGIERGNFDFSSGTYDSVIVTQNFASTGGQVDLDRGAGTPPGPQPTPPVPRPGQHDVLVGGRGSDLLKGFGGNDRLIGKGGNDGLSGGDGDDTLRGGADDDRLGGGNGNDRMYGGDGRDRLDGGAGRDALFGGPGRDVFVFGTGHGRDTIRDFEDDLDRLDLRGLHLATKRDLADAADQRGDHLFLGFGSDVLILRDTTLREMLDDVLI